MQHAQSRLRGAGKQHQHQGQPLPAPRDAARRWRSCPHGEGIAGVHVTAVNASRLMALSVPSLRHSGWWMRRKLGNHITRADYARFWKYCRFTPSVGFISHLIISLACLPLFMRAGVRFFSVQVWKRTEMMWEASTNNWFTLISETKLTRLKYCWNRRKYLIILNDITKEFRHVWTRLWRFIRKANYTSI